LVTWDWSLVCNPAAAKAICYLANGRCVFRSAPAPAHPLGYSSEEAVEEAEALVHSARVLLAKDSLNNN
jgi:hypothetical protein